MKKFKFCGCLKLRPSAEIFLDGALTLKMITQICFLLDFFITSSYAMVFVIVHSYVWVYMSSIFTV